MSRSETMPRPVHSYESHHPDDIARRERDSAFGNKVSRLKNVFQTENKNLGSNHIGYNRQLSKSPDTKRKRLPSEHASDVISSSAKNAEPSVDPNISDPQKFFETTSHVQRFQYTRAIFAKMEEQNKREQERIRTFNRRLSPSRDRAISPTSPVSRSPVSINRQRLPEGKPPVDYSNKPTVNYLTKPRSSSDPTKMEQEAERKARLHGDGAELLNHSKRADSVDTLNTETPITDKVPSAKWIRQRYEEEAKKKSPGLLSGSAPNLTSNRNNRFGKPDSLPLDKDIESSSNILHSPPGPRSPIRPSASPERTGIRTTYRTSPERPASSSSSSSYRSQVRTSLSDDPRKNLDSHSPERNSEPSRNTLSQGDEHLDGPTSKRLSFEYDETTTTTTTENSYPRRISQSEEEKAEAPPYRRFITRDDNTPRKEHSYYRRISNEEGKSTKAPAPPPPPSATHNDIITDVLGSAPPPPPQETKPEEQVVIRRHNNTRVTTSPPGSNNAAANNGGVLLPKRRSREDSSLSREEITASLNEADSYWQRMYGESVPETLDSSKMSDSTYSSGSGEEMARSESGHDLSEVKIEGSPSSPLSPMAGDVAVPRRPASWIARYQQQRNSRTSDSLDEKVTLGELNSRRSSQGSNQGSNSDVPPGSIRASADMEERVNEVTVNVTHANRESPLSSPVSRSSSESSSLPSVVKRLSTIEDPDIMNAPPSYPSPTRQSPTVYVSSPGSGEPDTSNEINLGGFAGETDTDRILDEDYDTNLGEDDRDNLGPLEAPNTYLQSGLGLKKTASPNESIDSMTPSEQENLLSKT